MFSGPVRGGTRGGQGDFKWSDVADDKDRENYLGHSILAPVGRWQKNKDITWYNKEGGAIDEDERQRVKREEIQRIKAAEEDALSAALGFKPAPRDPTTRAPETSSNAISLGPARVALEEETGSSEESEKRKRKEEKAARKAERAAKRERKMEEKSVKKISSSKSSKYPDLNSLRSTRLDRMVDNNDERTRDRRHSDYRVCRRSPHPPGTDDDRPNRSSHRPSARGRRSPSSERDRSPPRESTSHRSYHSRRRDHPSPDPDHHRAHKPHSHSNHHTRPTSPPAHDRYRRSVSPDDRRRDHRRRSRSPPRRAYCNY